MTLCRFEGRQTYDPVAGVFVSNASVQLFAMDDATFSNPLTVYDLAGVATTTLQASTAPQVPDFDVVDQMQVRWRSGNYNGTWTSYTAVKQLVQDAQSASQSAAQAGQKAVDQVQAYIQQGGGGTGSGAATWSSLAGKPTTFPPSDHTHPSSQISDASTVGRALIAAADSQTARAAIGAGTGNGTSNLQLGSTASTAAAGNHSHQASAIPFAATGVITATNVQDAIGQAASTGGSAGTSSTYVWKYASGAYPTLPSTQPAGVLTVDAQGPTQPTVIPSWIGTGANQATLFYRYAALT